MNLEELFQFALNIEEASINPGKDSEGNPQSCKETKIDIVIPRKQGGKGKNHKKNRGKYSILKGQEIPSCDFYGRKGYTESTCRMKQKAMASARKETKYRVNQWKKEKSEKAQAFATAAAASKQDDTSSDKDDKDKKAFMKSFLSTWKSSQKDKKIQKNKRKRSDNDASDSEQNYSMSFKIVALKPKRAKIGIPTTEIIGETTVKGRKTPLRIVIDTGSSRSIILNLFINKSLLVKNSRTTTKWTT
jgi:hypothetical protein